MLKARKMTNKAKEQSVQTHRSTTRAKKLRNLMYQKGNQQIPKYHQKN